MLAVLFSSKEVRTKRAVLARSKKRRRFIFTFLAIFFVLWLPHAATASKQNAIPSVGRTRPIGRSVSQHFERVNFELSLSTATSARVLIVQATWMPHRHFLCARHQKRRLVSLAHMAHTTGAFTWAKLHMGLVFLTLKIIKSIRKHFPVFWNSSGLNKIGNAHVKTI